MISLSGQNDSTAVFKSAEVDLSEFHQFWSMKTRYCCCLSTAGFFYQIDFLESGDCGKSLKGPQRVLHIIDKIPVSQFDWNPEAAKNGFMLLS
jgi:hypothetical protein